jgi:hypothetical protein
MVAIRHPDILNDSMSAFWPVIKYMPDRYENPGTYMYFLHTQFARPVVQKSFKHEGILSLYCSMFFAH